MVAAAGSFVLSARPAVSAALKSAVLQSIQRVAKDAKTSKELAEAIRVDMDSTQGLGWHVVVGKDLSVDIRYRKGCCAIAHNKTTGVKILVYRTTVATNSIPPVTLPASANSNSIKVNVMDSTMPEDRQTQVISTIQRLVASDSDIDVQCSQLKGWLTNMYGHTWHVATTLSRDLVGSVHVNPEMLLDVIVSTSQTKHVRFLVYQHSGYESTLDLMTLLHRVFLVIAAMAGALFLFYRMSFRSECGPSVNATEDCSKVDLDKAVAGEHGQFVTTIVVVVCIGLASLIRVSRNSIRQKIKHV
ncbi:unnamed protein product [Aphanomyces euteiches]|uniref:Dynein light chain n=1 Tax=Aphanomyces euteiches TaxID=100861 RepID=A0A6G0WNR1_9STRA|nr:hypothetical protein Ae201684_013313 [Aphanomyces euteiches]KAH9064674.1 hypothetical protein Ae201684P_003461 [Aphanomyces euteiches]KAH9103369.1 hypothetical protein LEN26_015302 [Aphanomyces euteiches]KAH9103857.1 hypothetical protein AeMF1_019907 [Aphanomyces euteiches]KAH9185093.1 hypothetical protein AeNC1_012932 [Aphanomyces euteiches]